MNTSRLTSLRIIGLTVIYTGLNSANNQGPTRTITYGGHHWALACNAVTLAPGRVVMNAGSPQVVAELERLGIEVIQV